MIPRENQALEKIGNEYKTLCNNKCKKTSNKEKR
jgi:hypothetical protein